MSLLRLIFVSSLHHWRMNLAVALGAAIGTAVLTGALVVGDSMQGSLRSLVLNRLGKIDDVLVPGRFFREKLANELKETDDFKDYGDSLVPVILLPASIENPNSKISANRMEVIGCNHSFWTFFPSPPSNDQLPRSREIVLNRPLAEKLGVRPGEDIVLRLPRPGAIPSDIALGDKRDTVRSYRLTVKSILPDIGAGRFSLRPNQQEPLNAFVPMDWLQERLEQSSKVNAMLLSLNDAGRTQELENFNYHPAANKKSLKETFTTFFEPVTHPQNIFQKHEVGDLDLLLSTINPAAWKPMGDFPVMLEDLGIRIMKNDCGFLSLNSESMVIEQSIENELVSVLQNKNENEKWFCPDWDTPCTVQPIFTYLANGIADGDRKIPYSTVTAIDFISDAPLGPFLSPKGKPLPPLREKEIALNSWAADVLQAKIGDTITLTYFEPESIEGKIQEKSVDFRLASIVELAGAADDRTLTPTVKGITDELTMADWDPPFPFDAKRIRPQDEKYWNDHGPTPKAFVSLAAGRKLWGSRFGQTTTLRIAPESKDQQKNQSELLKLKTELETAACYPGSLGFTFQSIKLQGLAAAQGTTPFNGLFIGFSFFIIVSSLMLVSLLFKLGVDRRAAEIGILSAVGWKPKQVRNLLFREGLLTASAGGVIGVPLGVGYAALMIWGLETWWLAAIVSPFLKLFITPASLMIGFFAGFILAMIVIRFAVRNICRLPTRQLLAGQIEKASGILKHETNKKMSWFDILWLVFLGGNVITWFFARRLGDWEAGMFFGGGALMLILTLAMLWSRLRRGATGPAVAEGKGNLFRLALRNAARNPGRSSLTIGLVASACFLIVAMSAFQLDPSQQSPRLDSGNGGLALAAESSQPIFRNLDTSDGRSALGFSDAEEVVLSKCRFYSFRIRSGDDASCLNLYKPRSPRILGLPPAFLERGGFAWTAAPANCTNPWDTLNASPPREKEGEENPVPVILEKNTANYSLQLWGGLGELYAYQESAKNKFSLEIAALLDNSIFQGDLLISEDSFLKKFPEAAGYRFFLVECMPEKTAEVQRILENRLGDYGFAAETTGRRLARFLAVQNTYLSTFQSLGGLGLLLGTLGLSAVQLRNMLERRGELALLRAVGFRRRKIAALVLLENAILLILGLASGILAAMVAVMPRFLSASGSPPWFSIFGILGLVFIVGMIAGFAAVRQVSKAPLLNALREEK